MAEIRSRTAAVGKKGDGSEPLLDVRAKPRSGDARKGAGVDYVELDKKIEKLQRTQLLRMIMLGISLITLVWFGSRVAPEILDMFSLGSSSPKSAGSQAALPGHRFGGLSANDRPSGKAGAVRLSADVEKREAVKEAFNWSWSAYEQHAMGADEYHPLSQSGSNLTSAGGVGYTVVDSLDSLLVMGFDDEYRRAVKWCRDNLQFDRDAEFNTFETTIRILGGLLSAYYLSSTHSSADIRADAPFFLERATDLGDRLLGAFSSPSGIPYSGVNLGRRVGIPDKHNSGMASLAEAASLQLEMKYLSHLTGDYVYWRKAERVTEVVRGQAVHDGVAPIFINPQNGGFVASEIRLGSRGDSYYEYLLKQWLQTDRQEPIYRDMYDEAMGGIKRLLISQTKASGLIYTHELHPVRHPNTQQPTWQISPKQDHLVCFLGGSFILGVTEGGKRMTDRESPLDWDNLDPRDMEDFVVGKGLIETCMKTHETKTGLAPEIAMFYQDSDEKAIDEDWYIKPSNGGFLIDGRNILRPETVESLFLAYRATGHQQYRDWGWAIFQSFNKHCRVPHGGYASIQDVRDLPAKQEDRMETFWLSETLKYLYLLFDDSTHIPLDEHVFNTEAHILPVFKPTYLTPFSTS